MRQQDIHDKIRAGWEIVAAAKYSGEMEDHLRLLRRGEHNLLPPELELLRDTLPRCERVIHSQCSHGLDALGLLNLGVEEVIGLDISEEMIRQARKKTAALGANARWYCTDVLDAPAELDGTADLVYTGKGALPWIMDLRAWAEVVARLAAPSGMVFVFEGHPLDGLWDGEAAELRLNEDTPGYFSNEPRENAGFPANLVRRVVQDADSSGLPERLWRPGEVMSCLADAGLRLEHFDEHPELYWDHFPNLPERVKSMLPHSYSILARKE